jgi:hypothetical protein
MTMTLPLMITDQSNPQNENLNLLVEIKFLNLFLYSLKKNCKIYKVLLVLGCNTTAKFVQLYNKKTKYYL